MPANILWSSTTPPGLSGTRRGSGRWHAVSSLRKHAVTPMEVTAKPVVPVRTAPTVPPLGHRLLPLAPSAPNPSLPIHLCPYLIWGSKSQIFIQGIFNSFVTDRRLLFYSDTSAKVTRRAPLRAPAGAAAEPRGARWVRWAQPTRAPVASTPQQRWRPGPSSLGPEAADRVAESARAHDNPGPSPARHAALLGWRPPSGLPSPRPPPLPGPCCHPCV